MNRERNAQVSREERVLLWPRKSWPIGGGFTLPTIIQLGVPQTTTGFDCDSLLDGIAGGPFC